MRNVIPCRSCQARIFFVRMAGGRGLMPVNEKPDKRGTVRLLEDGEGETMTALEAAAYEGEKYLVHWATCPNAAAWRRSKK